MCGERIDRRSDGFGASDSVTVVDRDVRNYSRVVGLGRIPWVSRSAKVSIGKSSVANRVSDYTEC